MNIEMEFMFVVFFLVLERISISFLKYLFFCSLWFEIMSLVLKWNFLVREVKFSFYLMW